MATFAKTQQKTAAPVVPMSFVVHPFDQPEKYIQLVREKLNSPPSTLNRDPIDRPRSIPQEPEVHNQVSVVETPQKDKQTWSFVTPYNSSGSTATDDRRAVTNNPRSRMLLRHSSSAFTGFQRRGNILTNDQVCMPNTFLCTFAVDSCGMQFTCNI